jgi:Flp pilus assembly protein TadD
MPKAPYFARHFGLAALLLGCTAMSGSAYAGWFDVGPKREGTMKEAKAAPADAGVNLEDSVAQAQALRLAGSYPEAIRHLSQLMMVASDDPRVVTEYGKTLAAMGRAQDAVNFLTRAQQLQPGDWTIYSALGVAYDQLGNQKDAQTSYEHALAIKPGEPSVLSNYALSRMLANDPEMAQKLAARAEIAGGSSDPKIARNIVMIRTMAPVAPGFAVNAPTPSPVPHTAMATPQAAPRVPVAAKQMPQPLFVQPPPMASNGNSRMIEGSPQMAQMPPQARDNRVVMQRVPEDPLAGPVAATHAPSPLQSRTAAAKNPANDMTTVRAEAPKPTPMPAPGMTTAASQANDLQARAEAIAKQLVNKPAAIAAAKTEANKSFAAKTEANKPSATMVKATETKPAPMPKVLAPTVKAAEVKHAPAPKVPPPAPVKAAAATPAPTAPKIATKPKDTIPGLRLSANAY